MGEAVAKASDKSWRECGRQLGLWFESWATDLIRLSFWLLFHLAGHGVSGEGCPLHSLGDSRKGMFCNHLLTLPQVPDKLGK